MIEQQAIDLVAQPTKPKAALSYYDIPHVENNSRIPVAAFRVSITKDETRLFSRALADYVHAIDIPDTQDGDYEITLRFDCARMLTRLMEDLLEAALDSADGLADFRFFPLIFQETESYARYVMFHSLNAVARLTAETERHLKSATEARFNDTANFYRPRLRACLVSQNAGF